jgi:hypothetical protein
MKTEERTNGPILCHGCKKETPISTKLNTPIACACGVSHSVVGVVVASGDDIPAAPDQSAVIKAIHAAFGNDRAKAEAAIKAAYPDADMDGQVSLTGTAAVGPALTVAPSTKA